ncbi:MULTISPECIES: DUF1642 domain-containing protein [Streptococcus]|uniref:DUF1642 domain-containing protein n=1 Tax=Streptococcus TaxID=1301 RepID=UPI00216B08B0|nr:MULTISPECIES: DUF1642 domain-containing protein [Streptococcus]
MNKQEVIEKIKRRIDYFSSERDYDRGYRAALNSTLLFFRELDEPVKPPEPAPWEPEKPVVPQFIDTWIQGAKYNGFDLYEAMTDETPDKTTTWIVCNPETFAKAWIYGYEVEKEKLYTVEIPNPHGLGHTVLVKDMYGNIFITHVMNSDWRKSKVSQLTEAEIKKDFDWAWQFKEEVKE